MTVIHSFSTYCDFSFKFTRSEKMSQGSEHSVEVMRTVSSEVPNSRSSKGQKHVKRPMVWQSSISTQKNLADLLKYFSFSECVYGKVEWEWDFRVKMRRDMITLWSWSLDRLIAWRPYTMRCIISEYYFLHPGSIFWTRRVLFSPSFNLIYSIISNSIEKKTSVSLYL